MVAPPASAQLLEGAGDFGLRQSKRQLRASMRAARAALPSDLRAQRSWAAAARFVAATAPLPPGPVAAFWSLGDEIGTLPLIEQLRAVGREVLLPRQVGKAQPLAFHRWRAGEPLAEGPFGVAEPLPAAPRLVPVILAVPLLAFDRAGRRLGYGAGFYDRTLLHLADRGQAFVAIGYGFDLQEVERVPTGPHDVSLPMIVTESRCLVPGHLDSGRAAP
jgi:5-formyltetrahydrofolate cyclo-ligase